MTTYLVTGGAGFIGSHLVEALVQAGNPVRVLDNLTTGTLARLESVRDRIDLRIGDLHDLNFVRAAVAGTEVIFHQAASPAPGSGGTGPDNATVAPGTDTLHVLIAAREAAVRRVVYASCASVYGDTARASEGDGLYPITELAPTHPNSAHAVGKLVGEQHCVAFTSMYGLDTVRLRYFNVFGPRQSRARPGADVIAVLEAMLTGQSPRLAEAAAQTPWDLIYVGDVVYANLLAADFPRGAGKVFNIGHGRPTTLADIIAIANDLLGTRLQPIHGPGADPAAVPLLADVTLAETHLGVCASTDLEHALRQCIAYYNVKHHLAEPAFKPHSPSQKAAAIRDH
jgi:UDP-glucose 4-epimerase